MVECHALFALCVPDDLEKQLSMTKKNHGVNEPKEIFVSMTKDELGKNNNEKGPLLDGTI